MSKQAKNKDGAVNRILLFKWTDRQTDRQFITGYCYLKEQTDRQFITGYC
jgi:hypothetical protein